MHLIEPGNLAFTPWVNTVRAGLEVIDALNRVVGTSYCSIRDRAIFRSTRHFRKVHRRTLLRAGCTLFWVKRDNFSAWKQGLNCAISGAAILGPGQPTGLDQISNCAIDRVSGRAQIPREGADLPPGSSLSLM